MKRGSDKHGPMKDDALEKEVEGLIQGSHPTRAEEALDSEPPADDDPEAFRGKPPPDKKPDE